MDAILLCAGNCTRLLPLTKEIPKCLLPLFKDNKTLLEYWIKALKENNIDGVIIDTCYLKEKIINFLDSNKRFGADVFSIALQDLKPIGHSIELVKNILDDEFLVINSDTYIKKEDIKLFIDNAKTTKEIPICIAVEKRENVQTKSLVTIENGKVAKFIEKPKIEMSGFSWAGICLMNKSIDCEDKQLSREIFQENKMSAIEIGNVIDIGDSIEVYNNARKKLRTINESSF